MKHLGDLTKLTGETVPIVDVITGGSPCFAAGSLVTTENGRIPIEDVKPGMVVLTHKKRWRTVKDCCCTGVKQTYELKGVGFKTIKATGNHPFYASRERGERKTAEWIQLKDLSTDCVLVGESNDDSEPWFEIESIEKADVCDVFNLSVDEDESYCVNGIVVHNCQNLSVAGNRKGLGGDESRLFLEQVRLVKEMRDVSKRMGNVRVGPRFMVWENVKGAFSCNGGEDFRRVLEEIVRIVEPDASVPRPPEGAWTRSGTILGDGWSIAWRLHDAQFWGVPQRRKRIALVADFGGSAAPEILFEREGVSGDSEQGGEEGEEPPPAPEGSSRPSGEPIVLESNQNHATITEEGVSPTLSASMGLGGGYVPMIAKPTDVLNDQGGASMYVSTDVTGTFTASTRHHEPIIMGEGKRFDEEEKSAYGFDPGADRDVGRIFIKDCAKTLTNGSCPGHHNGVLVSEEKLFEEPKE